MNSKRNGFPRGLALSVFLGSSALLSSGCSDTNAGARPDTGGELSIGFIGQFSNSQRIAILNLVLRNINEQGGVSIDGREMSLKLVPLDHKGSVEGGVEAMRALKDDGVSLVIDPNWSSIILGTAPDFADGAAAFAKENDMLIVSGSATSPLISTLDDDGRVFRTVPSDSIQGRVGAAYLFERGIRRVSLVHRDDAYGDGLASAFEAAFGKLGGEVLAEAVYDVSSLDAGTDYSNVLDLAFAEKPEAVVLIAFDEAYVIGNQMVQGGYLDSYGEREPLVFGSDGFFSPENIPLNMPAEILERLSGTIPKSDVSTESYAKMVEVLVEGGFESTEPFDGPRYDAAFLIALGIQATGSDDASLVKEVLAEISRSDPGDVVIRPGEWKKAKEALLAGKSLDYEGASGPIEFDSEGDPTIGTVGIWNVEESAGEYSVEESELVPY